MSKQKNRPLGYKKSHHLYYITIRTPQISIVTARTKNGLDMSNTPSHTKDLWARIMNYVQVHLWKKLTSICKMGVDKDHIPKLSFPMKLKLFDGCP